MSSRNATWLSLINKSARRLHALLLAQKKAATKLAMLLELQEHLQLARGEPPLEIYLPMDRSSIAAYLGLTLAALSRAFRTMVSKQIISSRNRHHIKILDRNAFNRLADARSNETWPVATPPADDARAVGLIRRASPSIRIRQSVDPDHRAPWTS
jgi:hypothetical protein